MYSPQMEWELHTVPFFFTKDGEPSSPGSGLTFRVYSQFCISILSLSAVAKNAELNLLNAVMCPFFCANQDTKSQSSGKLCHQKSSVISELAVCLIASKAMLQIRLSLTNFTLSGSLLMQYFSGDKSRYFSTAILFQSLLSLCLHCS